MFRELRPPGSSAAASRLERLVRTARQTELVPNETIERTQPTRMRIAVPP